MNKTICENMMINECLIDGSNLNSFTYDYEYENYKFMVKIETIEVNKRFGSGFLIIINQNKYLITCQHNIKKELIDLKKKIKIYFDYKNDNEKEEREIKLDRDIRKIKSYMEDKQFESDVIAIEIIESDNINEKIFFHPDINRVNNYKIFENKEILIPQFPYGGSLKYSTGTIKKILQNNHFIHSASTCYGSSGSPIFLRGKFFLIGIHIGTNFKENYGIFLDKILLSLSESEKQENNYIYINGYYYVGNIIEGLPSGEGAIYDKNKNIKYEGNFENGQANGKGKFYYDNGVIQYDGEWSNGLRSGIGKYYDNKGYLKYEGYFFNDQLTKAIYEYHYDEDNYNNNNEEYEYKNFNNSNIGMDYITGIFNDNDYYNNNQENNYIDNDLNSFYISNNNNYNYDELNKNLEIKNNSYLDNSQIDYNNGNLSYYSNNQDDAKHQDDYNNNYYIQLQIEQSYENNEFQWGYGLYATHLYMN